MFLSPFLFRIFCIQHLSLTIFHRFIFIIFLFFSDFSSYPRFEPIIVGHVFSIWPIPLRFEMITIPLWDQLFVWWDLKFSRIWDPFLGDASGKRSLLHFFQWSIYFGRCSTLMVNIKLYSFHFHCIFSERDTEIVNFIKFSGTEFPRLLSCATKSHLFLFGKLFLLHPIYVFFFFFHGSSEWGV